MWPTFYGGILTVFSVMQKCFLVWYGEMKGIAELQVISSKVDGRASVSLPIASLEIRHTLVFHFRSSDLVTRLMLQLVQLNRVGRRIHEAWYFFKKNKSRSRWHTFQCSSASELQNKFTFIETCETLTTLLLIPQFARTCPVHFNITFFFLHLVLVYKNS